MILLDTQIVVWLAIEPDRLSPRSEAAIAEARQADGLAISDKTLWEIAMLVSKRRINVRTSAEAFLHTVETLFRVEPITSAIAVRATSFSANFPQDPSDRIIAATAVSLGLPLVTADRKILASSEVDCIW